MYQTKHAQQMAERYRELVEGSGDSLSDAHFDELKLIIEAGLDAVLLESMESVALKLERLALDIKQSAET